MPRALWALCAVAALAGCGSGGGEGGSQAGVAALASSSGGCAPNEKCAAPARPEAPQASAPALLAGAGGSPAAAALPSVSGPPASYADIASGRILTRIVVYLRSDATVEQFNAMSVAIGASAIVSSRPGIRVLSMQIPRRAGAADIEDLVAQVRTMPGVLYASAARAPKRSVLPGEEDGSPAPKTNLDHLLMSRFPQAWNARGAQGAGCAESRVRIVVWDSWGQGSLRPGFRSDVSPASFTPSAFVASLDPSDPDAGHGYDVALVAAARAGSFPPVGAFPASFANCLEIVQIEADGREFLDTALDFLSHFVAAPKAPTVLNISVGFLDPECGPQGNQACTAQSLPQTPPAIVKARIEERVMAAAAWATALRGLNLEAAVLSNVLISFAAGNVDEGGVAGFEQNYQGFRDTRFFSPITLATHLADLESLLTSSALWRSGTFPGAPDATFTTAEAAALIDKVRNLLGDSRSVPASSLVVVDSASCGGGEVCSEEPGDAGRSFFNYLGGQLRAVGEYVRFDGDRSRGTSFSAPQVAGLAAYLWSLSPSLRTHPPDRMIDLLRVTGLPVGGDGVPLIRAYAATLALDQFDPQALRVRKALLDVNGDGQFDHLDLLRFEQVYRLADPAAPTIPDTKDHSRFDLNGDGATGGILIAPFDLKVEAAPFQQPVIGTATYEIPVSGGAPLQVTLNEAAVSDLEILCYYAYSNLYTGSATLRSDILRASRCLRARMDLTLAGAPASGPITISGPAPLQVTLTQPDGAGGATPLVNVPVEFTPSCATLSSTAGQTDAAGRLTTQLTPSTGCASVSVQVVARESGTAQPIVSGSLSATVVSTPGPTRMGGSITIVTPIQAPVDCFEQTFFEEVTSASLACPNANFSLSIAGGGTLNATGSVQSGSISLGQTFIDFPIQVAAGSSVLVKATIRPQWFSGTGQRFSRVRLMLACGGVPDFTNRQAWYEVADGTNVVNDLEATWQAASSPSDPGNPANACRIEVFFNCAADSGRPCQGSGELVRIETQ